MSRILRDYTRNSIILFVMDEDIVLTGNNLLDVRSDNI